MNWEKVEKFAKFMEKWHDLVFPSFWLFCFFGLAILITFANIGIFFHFDSIIQSVSNDPMALLTMQIFRVLILVFDFVLVAGFIYVMGFMGFKFPIRFKGDGSGRKNKPPYAFDG